MLATPGDLWILAATRKETRVTPPPTQTHPLTYDVLRKMPDDGQRYELIA